MAAADRRSTIDLRRSLPGPVGPRGLIVATIAMVSLATAGCGSDQAATGGDPDGNPAATIGSSADDDGNPDNSDNPDGADNSNDTDADAGHQAEVESPNGEIRVVDQSMVPIVAADLNASTVLATFGDEQVLWHDGSFVELHEETSGFNLWSDGRFVYGLLVGADEVPERSVAMTLDGEIVCTAIGRARHATTRTDGSYVMAVEGPEPKDDTIPLFAVDCASGDSQPIEPAVVFTGDGGTRITERIAGRVFTGFGDAEGNADFFNEDGRSLNGDDYAGYHTFTDDASIVVYGDMGVGSGPHFSPVIRARDTTDGRELWTTEFEQPFQHIFHVGDHTAVLFHADFDALFDQNPVSDRAVLFDTVTGDRLVEADVGFQVDFIG